MKVNVNLDLDDQSRLMLADLIDGKETKRLATRSEIRTLCANLIDALVDIQSGQDLTPTEAHNGSLSGGERDLVQKLKAEGRPVNYIRGQLQVYRSVRSKK